VEEVACSNFPKLHCVVCGAAGEECGGGVNVDGEDGTEVALVCSETGAVGGHPGADHIIFGCGEQEITITVEFDLTERTGL